MAVIERDERRWTIKSMGLGHSQRNEVHGPQVEPDHPVQVVPASQLRGAVEAERAEIVTLLQEIADAEPRMSEARIAVLAAAKRIHARGR